MKTKLFMLLGLLLLGTPAMAQTTATTFRIKGQLLDSLTQEGEPYATIKITKANAPDKPVKMLVTDMKGRFQEKVPGTGSFVMNITSVGRNPIVKPFAVKAGQEEVDFGVLYITDASTELGQVEVVAQKPLVKADIDKIEYNVQDDPDSKTNSVLEMLRKVPLVTVDGEDKIQVNGSSSFKVFVNGKPNNMMSNNPTEVLKSMPANSIKNIEVITNPGPKYDAEGVGGILNIITVGSGMEGYTATLSGNASNTGVGGGMFGTVQSGKLTVSARYNYSYNNSPDSYSSSSQRVLGTPSEGSSNVDSKSVSDSRGSYQSGSMEASYEIDTLRLLSASFGLWGGGNKGNGSGELNAFSPVDASNVLYKYATHNRSKSSWYSIDGGIDYQRSSSKVKNRLFTLSYKINTRPNDSNTYLDYDDAEAAPDWEAFLARLNNLHTKATQNSTEHTFQADYTTPIGTKHTLESGVKYILRNNTSETDRYEQLLNAEDYEYDQLNSSHYKHRNDILAAYFGYGLKLEKLTGRLGLRYEHTMQDVEYRLGNGDDFRKHFNDVVPSASLGWKLTAMSNLRFGYNMRIYRPGIWYLNPYLNDNNPMSISQGNPNLDSEKNHSVNITYSNFTQKFNINFSASYSFTNNSIESVAELMPDTEITGLQNPTGKEVLYTTYKNIGKSRRVNFSGYVNWNATKNTRIYANMFGGYTYLEGANGLSNDGWNLFVYGGAQQTLPKDWRISLNVMMQTPWISLQGKGSSYSNYSLSVNKSFLKQRLTLSAYCSNLFHKYTTFENLVESADFRQESSYKYNQQRFGLSISYRFGELKASVKKARRTISNDDVKSGGSGGGGN